MIRNISNTLKKSFSRFDYRTLKNMGIGKTLLLWFLAIALIPLTTLSFINYLNYYRGLNVLSKKSLFTTSQLRVNYLNSYFREMSDYIEDMSANRSTVTAMQQLQDNFNHLKKADAGYTHSKAYKEIAHELRSEIQKTWIPEGILNFYFISAGGTILFEMNEGQDLGAELFRDPLSSTKLSKTCKKVLTSGKPGFSDLEIYPPSTGELSGFLVQTLISPHAEKIGIMAIQISTEHIDKIIQYGIGFGNTGKVYLIGLDLNLRSASKFSNPSDILKKHEENPLTLTWQGLKVNNITLSADGKPIVEEVSSFTNSEGVVVMGLYRSITELEKLGVNWALVEEINQEEAHAVARELSSFAKLSLIITTIVVFLLSFIVTRRFVNPIKRISEWAKQVAHGELVIKDIKVAQNEVGEMKDTFNWLVTSLQSFAEVSQSVALGDYSKTVNIRSDKDSLGISMNQMVESFRTVVKQAKAIASGDYSTTVMPRSEQDTLGIALFDMTKKLREASIEIMNQDWLKTGINELSIRISGEKSIKALSEEVIQFLAHYLEAQLGLLYLNGNEEKLYLTASYAGDGEGNSPPALNIGEGLIGQVAKERKPMVFFSANQGLPWVNIGPEKIQPQHFILFPVIFEGQLLGVIEFGSFKPFDDQKQHFLEVSLENISVAITTARSRERVQELLIQTQEQARELVMQKEELRQINQELEEQTKALKLSEENLQHQQEELRVINEELEERTKVLELQRDDIRKKNEALEIAQHEIHQKAEALEIASRYKSEFLANMSHELRTPLNSILVLSEILATNKNGGMSEEEVEFSNVINASGKDLLELINDILDLSKVEAGRLEIDIEDMNLEELEEFVIRTFSPLTNKKNISLTTKIEENVPEVIQTDPQRVLQIIKNLMSNAIKFTAEGGVGLHVFRPDKTVSFTQPELIPDHVIGIEVSDTGIGIAKEKLKVIFEAFQQADGTINRKFGGTGLGLTISRSLSRLLGGEIQLQSKPGKGSVFTLYLPISLDTKTPREKALQAEPQNILPKKNPDPVIESHLTPAFLPDTVFENKKILIVDDDMRNVFVLSKILEEKKVNILIGRNGREGIEKVQENPDLNLVLMDIMMPEIDGYTAMREIRKDKRFAQLPIIALTAKAMKGDREKCIEAGANDYLSKPVQPEKLLNLLRVWLQK